MTVSVDIRTQIPMLTNPPLGVDVRVYLEQVRRAKLEEVAAIERLLDYRQKPCPSCGYVKECK